MKKIQYNAPVVLTFVITSGIALFLGELTNNVTTTQLFSVYRSPLWDPLTFVRLFLHVLGHSDMSHYTNNMMMILILGPIVEERYGSGNLLFLIATTALVTGLVHCFFSSGTILLGSSGIVFMLIFLASLSGMKKNKLPLTLFLLIIIYFGKELYNGIFFSDNISQLTHMVGGCCGIFLGLVMRKR